ncbi:MULTISPECIES: gas vesicle protein GvpJ [Amycolatopsis]|uniref:gas vesicle protein GvpJ n=1 Tax=Amycolatopsis TaxID=1813 RepID=UPI00254B078A|nr:MULTISPECIES: gas vesicle protein GvpJ [unclassified Amycolatopsis]
MSAPAPTTGGLAETLNILLDKGLVIDATIRVSVIGIEILTIEAKIVIASVDTYIRYLEAMQRIEAQRQALPPGTVPAPGTQGIAGTYGLLPVATPIPVGFAQQAVVTPGFAQATPAPSGAGEGER